MTRHKLAPLFPTSVFEVCVGWDPALRSYYLDTRPAQAPGRDAQAQVPLRLLGRYYREIDDVDELIAVARTHAQVPQDLDIVLRADPARVTTPPRAHAVLTAG